jgi:hypothetical protein
MYNILKIDYTGYMMMKGTNMITTLSGGAFTPEQYKRIEEENGKMQGSDYDYLARVIEHVALDVWRVVVANKNYTYQYPIRVGKKFMYDELINAGYKKAAEQWKRFMQTDPENGKYFLTADGTYTKNYPWKTKESLVKNEIGRKK